MNQKKQLVKNTVIIAIGKVSTQVLSYLLLRLYTTKLSPEQYGIYDFIATLVAFICPVVTLLMEESMFRFLIDAEGKKEQKKVISQTITCILLGTVIFSVIAGIIVNVISYEYGLVLILFAVSNIMISLSNSLARGLGKLKMYSISNFILGISTVILNVVFILGIKADAKGLVWSNIIANTGTAVVMLFMLGLPKYIEKPDFRDPLMKQMIKYSVPLVPNSLSWTIISLSDRLMITAMIDSAANGIYSMACKFPSILNTVYGFFSTAWKESASRILKEENKNDYYNSIFSDLKKLLVCIAICLIAVMPFAFPIFINSQYDEAFLYIPLLAISVYYSCLSNFYGGIFSAYKNTKVMGTTTIVSAVINIVLNLILIPFFGIWAAAGATLFSNVVVYLYRKKVLKKYIRLKKLKMLGPVIVLGIVIFCYYARYIPVIGPNLILKWGIHAIGLIIAIIYTLFINKRHINKIKDKVKNIIVKRKIRKQGEYEEDEED